MFKPACERGCSFFLIGPRDTAINWTQLLRISGLIGHALLKFFISHFSYKYLNSLDGFKHRERREEEPEDLFLPREWIVKKAHLNGSLHARRNQGCW